MFFLQMLVNLVTQKMKNGSIRINQIQSSIDPLPLPFGLRPRPIVHQRSRPFRAGVKPYKVTPDKYSPSIWRRLITTGQALRHTRY